jgi:hypothetical protein
MSHPKTGCLLCLLVCCAGSVTRAPSQTTDSTHAKGYYHYFSLTLLTGTGFLLSGNNSHSLQVSFPYSQTDARGARTDTLFNSRNAKPYGYPKVFILPLGFEVGGLRQFGGASWSFELIGGWTSGYHAEVNYGYHFYLNGFGRHERNPAEKTFVISPSLQLSYVEDGAYNDPAKLGSIDNVNKTISAFGRTSGPEFSITTHSRYGSYTKTYATRTLDIGYGQEELSLMPRISISNNPYLHRYRCEVVVGYNIPWLEKGSIFLYQNDGNGNRQGFGDKLSLRQPGLTVTYDNQPIRSAPYRFPNYYLGFILSPTHWRHRRTKPSKPPVAPAETKPVTPVLFKF